MATDAVPEPSAPKPAGAQGCSPALPALAGNASKLSDDLASILREFEVETVTLRDVLGVLHGRGFVLLVLLLALPFCTPIPLPGLSTPFGLVIALIALRLALGQKPWLPIRLLDTKLSPKMFAKVFAAARKILRAFELFLRPRLLWITGSAPLLQLHAVPIFLSALLLLLPLPVPFSNLLPAASILLLASGLLERDGLFIVLGYVSFLATLVFFGSLGIVGAEAFEALKRRLMG